MSSDFTIQAGHVQVQMLRGDITAIAVDAIVNAANAELEGGGGVDGAIHTAGGPAIMRELDSIRARIGRCETGSAVVTGAGNLPAKWVFHAVGPIYRGGQSNEAHLLASCYRTCLQLAGEHAVQTISFPSISTGVYRYPAAEAAEIALQTTVSWLAENRHDLRTVKLVQYSDRDAQIYRDCALKLRGTLSANPM